VSSLRRTRPSAQASRLPRQPDERISRAKVISFSFDGRTVEAQEGDTVGSALHASGRRTLSRSFKYHRPRGLMCCAGQCPNCLVEVDGSPGVRACTETVREGMRVVSQNRLPSLDFDVMRIVDIAGGPFTPPGFYYKTFMWPRPAWPLYEKMLRHVAGLGRLRSKQREREWRTEYRRRHADVLVVGGGPSGLAAAIAAAEGGADTVLADDGPEPGGHLLYTGGRERARELTERARAAGVEILSNAPALGFYEGLVPVWQGDTLHQVRARRHVFATGTIEQPLVFAGNDLPGVMLSGGALRLVNMYAVRPGYRAVVATTDDRGLDAALALHRVGVDIAAVGDLRSTPGPAAKELAELGIPVLPATTVLEAKGRRRVEGAVVGPVGGGAPSASEKAFACDLVVVSGGVHPSTSLIQQAGVKAHYDVDRATVVLERTPAHIHAAGEVAGARGAEHIELSGTAAGLDAADSVGDGETRDRAPARLADARARLTELDGQVEVAAVEPPAAAGEGRGKCFACVCEDITAKDFKLGVAEGYDQIELAKRYLTVTMGPCQGRMCQVSSARLMARESGQSMQEIGSTTSRPPWSTVPMGALAGRPFEPAKRSSIHARHRELGGNVKWAGDWRRAYDYGDPEGEALNVHENVGVIDVSTLGKLLVQGPEAGQFLDRLYPNRVSTVKPGRIRYGVLTSDAGRITDDGTICRIDDDTFYVTTTSSGAGAVEQWFTWWLADWRMAAHVTDLTQGIGAVNVAGPRARDVLAGLTDLDCSNEAFGYLDAKRAPIAGVPCLILRIGFTGELGYEIHFPSAQGQDLWDALMEAGREHGIRPFGLEPQRILRLQKLHILIGQDTDSESNPYSAAMPWVVKLDKEEDFIGRWALQRAAEQPRESALVGFTLANGDVPTEGAAIVADGGAVTGQVTSSRYSRQLGRVIGMAWVPAELASDGASITISDNGRTLRGEVQTTPFFDPEGEVLRS
jgi:sarcosine oxidase subunit alpha